MTPILLREETQLGRFSVEQNRNKFSMYAGEASSIKISRLIYKFAFIFYPAS